MSLSLVASKAFALKLKIHCTGCERKLKQMLQKVQGVHSVRVDAKQGHVLITGTVDPPTILMMLEKLGRKAELLWEQGPAPVTRSSSSSSKVIKPAVLSDLENLKQLSAIPGVKTVEVTNTVKLTFRNGSVAEMTSIRKPQPQSLPPPSPGRHGLCTVPCSCSRGCFHGGNGNSANCAVHYCQCHWEHSPRVAFGCNVSPPGPAPPWEYGIPSSYEPSAPPPPPPPPPPASVKPYPGMFSDENPQSSCIIM